MSNQIYFEIPDNSKIDNEPNWVEMSIGDVFYELNKLLFPINITNKGIKQIAIFGKRDGYLYYTLSMEVVEEIEIKLNRYNISQDKSLKDRLVDMYGSEEKVEKIIALVMKHYKQPYRERND